MLLVPQCASLGAMTHSCTFSRSFTKADKGSHTDFLAHTPHLTQVMEMLGAKVEWSPYSIRITGPKAFGQPIQVRKERCGGGGSAEQQPAQSSLNRC